MAEIKGYDFPDALYYHGEHAWVRLEGDGTVTVGMNDFFQKEAGDVVHVDLPFEGDEVEAGETCAKLQSSKWIGKLVAPIGGEIVEINEELEGDSTLINQSPYDEGWVLRVEPSSWDDEAPGLMKGADAITPWLEQEIARAEAEKEK